MKYLIYDHTFEGLLTAIFTVFEYRYEQVKIISEQRFTPILFGEEVPIYTDATKAKRVLTKVESLVGKEGVQTLLYAFVSEEEGMENNLLEAVQLILKHPTDNALTNFAHPAILSIRKAAKSVGREVHRMKEFVRFEQVGDLYFAKITPFFDVLPLVVPHFRNRFSDQKWVLYDPQRLYGFAYDLQSVTHFTPADKHFGITQAVAYESYETLWRTYFQHINIKERKNQRYQMRNLPKRYWKYLPEM